jgi:hypothetical protein
MTEEDTRSRLKLMDELSWATRLWQQERDYGERPDTTDEVWAFCFSTFVDGVPVTVLGYDVSEKFGRRPGTDPNGAVYGRCPEGHGDERGIIAAEQSYAAGIHPNCPICGLRLYDVDGGEQRAD